MKKLLVVALLAGASLTVASDVPGSHRFGEDQGAPTKSVQEERPTVMRPVKSSRSYCPVSQSWRWPLATVVSGVATVYAGSQVRNGGGNAWIAGATVGGFATTIAAVKWYGRSAKARK